MESRDAGRFNCVSILVGLDRILVRSSGHQQIAGVDVHHWILWIGQNEPLEIKEGQVIVSNKICALSTIDVRLLESLIEVERDRKIFHGFRQDAETCVGATTGQVELRRRLLLRLDGLVEVFEGVEEVVHLEIEQPSEEVETRFRLAPAAVGYGLIHKLFRLKDLIKFNMLVHIVTSKRVSIASHD